MLRPSNRRIEKYIRCTREAKRNSFRGGGEKRKGTLPSQGTLKKARLASDHGLGRLGKKKGQEA